MPDIPAFLKPGDIIFQDLLCGDFCTAIETVTHGWQGRSFSHCGLVTTAADGSLQVIEAVSEGVKFTPLKEFLAKPQRSDEVVVGRLKTPWKPLIGQALAEAETLVGKPYDSAFDLQNEGLYCSELVYKVFLWASNGQQVFELAPMTFKDPATSKFFPVWATYFKELGMAIPEGKPGLNPGSISRSDKLVIFTLKNIEAPAIALPTGGNH